MVKGILSVALMSVALSATAAGSVTDMIQAATEANAKAKAMGYEWNVTGKAIKAAKEALKAGETAKAEELAAHAKYIAEASVDQAMDEQEAWKMRVAR